MKKKYERNVQRSIATFSLATFANVHKLLFVKSQHPTLTPQFMFFLKRVITYFT